jgi:transcriptional regulator with XRE-family HTH domain
MLPRKFRELRTMAELTQHKTARLSHIERSRISLFENGHIELQPQEVTALRRALARAISSRVMKLQDALAGLRSLELPSANVSGSQSV